MEPSESSPSDAIGSQPLDLGRINIGTIFGLRKNGALGLGIDRAALDGLHQLYLETAIDDRDDKATMQHYIPDYERRMPRWLASRRLLRKAAGWGNCPSSAAAIIFWLNPVLSLIEQDG